jgi:hypothetical protein
MLEREECSVRQNDPVLLLRLSESLLRLLMLCAGSLPGSFGVLLFEPCSPEFLFDAAAFRSCFGVLRLRSAMMSTENCQLVRPFVRGARSEQSRPEPRLRQAMDVKCLISMLKLTRCFGLCLPRRRRHRLEPSGGFYGGIMLCCGTSFGLSQSWQSR